MTIPPGFTTAELPVAIVADTLDEPDETFFLNVTQVTNATIADGQGVATIVDDDVTVSISDVRVVEGTGPSASTVAVFTVSLSHPSDQPVVLVTETSDGTAISPQDYPTTRFPSVTIPPGFTTAELPVAIVADALDEPDETFFLNVTQVTNATIGDGQGVATIVDDDDPAPTASITQLVNVSEGNAGTTGNAVFTVTLTAASTQPVTVSYRTADGSGTATPGEDYTSTSGTLTFNPGEPLSQEIRVAVIGDTEVEVDETFIVSVQVVGREDGDFGTATIFNDDIPTVSINDVSVIEGNTDERPNAVFTVTLSAASQQTVTVHYDTEDGSARGIPSGRPRLAPHCRDIDILTRERRVKRLVCRSSADTLRSWMRTFSSI